MHTRSGKVYYRGPESRKETLIDPKGEVREWLEKKLTLAHQSKQSWFGKNEKKKDGVQRIDAWRDTSGQRFVKLQVGDYEYGGRLAISKTTYRLQKVETTASGRTKLTLLR